MKDKIDRLLRERQSLPHSSQEFHDSIMRAVRASRSEAATQPVAPRMSMFSWPRLAYGMAIICVAALSAFLWVHQMDRHPIKTASISAAPTPALADQLQATWNLLDQVGTNGPALLARPITQQLDQLSSDFHKTTQLLLASLPMPPTAQPQE